MFRGSSSINLDGKGRLTIPTRYREELKDCCERKMIVTLAMDERGVAEPGCLWLYPLPEWEKTEKIISALPTMNKAAGNLRRFLIGNAQECEMDSQGRMLVSEQLRTIAEMEKKIVLVGQLSKFEIWAEDAWNTKQNEWRQGGDMAGLEELGNLSF